MRLIAAGRPFRRRLGLRVRARVPLRRGGAREGGARRRRAGRWSRERLIRQVWQIAMLGRWRVGAASTRAHDGQVGGGNDGFWGTVSGGWRLERRRRGRARRLGWQSRRAARPRKHAPVARRRAWGAGDGARARERRGGRKAVAVRGQWRHHALGARRRRARRALARLEGPCRPRRGLTATPDGRCWGAGRDGVWPALDYRRGVGLAGHQRLACTAFQTYVSASQKSGSKARGTWREACAHALRSRSTRPCTACALWYGVNAHLRRAAGSARAAPCCR